MTSKGTSKDIDAVVTWVDGADPGLGSNLYHASNDSENRGFTYLPHGRGRERFVDSNEIEYCIRGIRKFAPWVRRLFLVTAGQTPKFLDARTKQDLDVTLVDHKTIFEGHEYALPTFNSISIGSMLYRIPGLAEHYIYFNDDTIPIRPFKPSDFFRDDKVVLRGRWERMPIFPYIPPQILGLGLHILSRVEAKSRSTHLLPQMRAAIAAGYKGTFFHLDHAPHPARTETLRSFFSGRTDLITKNVRHRFRNIRQLTASALAYHLEARNDNHIVLDITDAVTLDFRKQLVALSHIPKIYSRDVKFLCLQDLQHAPPAARDEVESMLKESLR